MHEGKVAAAPPSPPSSSATRGGRRHRCRGSGGDEELGKAAVGEGEKI